MAVKKTLKIEGERTIPDEEICRNRKRWEKESIISLKLKRCRLKRSKNFNPKNS